MAQKEKDLMFISGSESGQSGIIVKDGGMHGAEEEEVTGTVEVKER